MKVILLENLRRIGSIGEVIDVKRGFARNYLIANKKALYASKENISEVEKIKADLSKKDNEKKKEAIQISEQINGKEYGVKKLSTEKQVSEMINEISSDLASDMAYSPSSLSKFIGLCNYIKTSLLICDIHHNLESDIDEAVCKECENMLLKGPGSVY